MGQASKNNNDTASITAKGYPGYQDAVYDQLAAIIEEPVTPMVAPAKTVRTLILPYADPKGEGRLYMPRFIYSLLEQPRFVLGDYLSGPANDFAGALANGLMVPPRTDLPVRAPERDMSGDFDEVANTLAPFNIQSGSN